MKPAARIQAAIELLERIETPEEGRAAVPADAVVSSYFRGRRYIGSKDRRAIGDLVYGVLRNRARILWHAGDGLEPRRLVLAALLLVNDQQPDEVSELFDGTSYGPEPLSETELALLTKLQEADQNAEPINLLANMPDWLNEKFAKGVGEDVESEARAMTGSAPVDLRVNTLRTDRALARKTLTGQGIDTEETPWSPLGLRLPGRAPISSTKAYRKGLVEIQDEGSQIAAGLVEAQPGMSVLDLCAGGGGKTLAVAASMRNDGQIVAADVSEARLKELTKRGERAGVTIVRAVLLLEKTDLGGPFDRVLIDAPCSGMGSWRRHPEAAWRLTPEQLSGYQETQADLLDKGAGLVAPGGRLVYVTCSLMHEENESQILALMDRHAGFERLNSKDVWERCYGTVPPENTSVGGAGKSLLLTPYRTGTDGFFISILERTA